MLKRFFSKKEKEVIPDKPIGFGYKNKWIAVKSCNKEEVAKFLNLKKVKESNWEDGIKYGYEKGIFITPEINGWILVLGIDISDLDMNETRELLETVSTKFDECQIFLTQRTIEYHFWGLAKKGKIERLYSFFIESEESLLNVGEPTAVEKKYRFINSLSKKVNNYEHYEGEDVKFPNEQIVMEIAENWSINPTKIKEYKNLEGIGLIGK